MRQLLTLVLIGLFLGGCVGPTTVAVVVRHAEKQTGPNPALTAQGQVRAEALRDRLAGANVVAVYSTDTTRTRQTAAPLAEALGVPVLIYRTPAQIASRVMTENEGDTVLIVGHSNTLGDIVEAFGADVPGPISGGISENDYDNLITVVINGAGEAGAVHSNYGAASP